MIGGGDTTAANSGVVGVVGCDGGGSETGLETVWGSSFVGVILVLPVGVECVAQVGV